MAKILPVQKQNKIKEYIMIVRAMQVLFFLSIGMNHWYFGDYRGSSVFIALMVILQFVIIALQTKIRRSRALYLKTFGKPQPELEKYF